MIGSDEWGREGGKEGGTIKEGASELIRRGNLLTAVYPALFPSFHLLPSVSTLYFVRQFSSTLHTLVLMPLYASLSPIMRPVQSELKLYEADARPS